MSNHWTLDNKIETDTIGQCINCDEYLDKHNVHEEIFCEDCSPEDTLDLLCDAFISEPNDIKAKEILSKIDTVYFYANEPMTWKELLCEITEERQNLIIEKMDISNSNIKTLSHKLNLNTIAVARLEQRIESLRTLPFYRLFGQYAQQREDIRKQKDIKDRVLRMRLNLLDRLDNAIITERFYTQQEINEPLKKSNNVN